MKTIIKTLDNNGRIENKAIYTIDPLRSLVAYLEQTINKNFNTWQYKTSKFLLLIKETHSKNGFTYDNGIMCISAYMIK